MSMGGEEYEQNCPCTIIFYVIVDAHTHGSLSRLYVVNTKDLYFIILCAFLTHR